MSPRIKMLARVQQTRKRLRDAAAGELIQAEQAADAATDQELDAHAHMEDVLDQASAALGQATSVQPFFALDENRDAATRRIVSAQEARKAAERASSERRQALIEKEQELRRTEKLLERERDRFMAGEARREQKADDDRAGARTRKPA